MKRFSLLLFIIIFFGFKVSSKCPWGIGIALFTDGIQTTSFNRYDPNPFFVAISPGDSVLIHFYGEANCSPNSLVFIRNGDTIYNSNVDDPFHYTAFDTGHYYFKYQNFDMLSSTYAIFELNISSAVGTGIHESAGTESLEIYQSNPGVFETKSGRNLKQAWITDAAGRTIVQLENRFSEIDLRDFLPGIYFYTIVDEAQRIWRGKLISNY